LKRFRPTVRIASAALVAALGLVSCAGNQAGIDGAGGAPPQGASNAARTSSSASPIQHIVVVVQENRSFDDFFATFPNADGTTTGLMKTSSGPVQIPLVKSKLVELCDFNHAYHKYLEDYDGGAMDGFNLEGGTGICKHKATAPYQYVDPAQIAPYWDMATQYVLGDHLFQTQGSASFTGHQDLIAGATTINPKKTTSLIDLPTIAPWGCDAPKGTKTSVLKVIGSKLRYYRDTGPFPCLKYSTMRDLLDAKGVSWKYYSPPVVGNSGAIWNAFEAIKAVRYGPEWGTNVTDSDTQIFTDISGGTLPAVSWLIPDKANSDHPQSNTDTGPSWVASVVNAIGQSSYWDSTAIVIVWDDWGGFYDHVPPPFFDQWGGLGFRVPMIVVSAYARQSSPTQPGYVSHTQYEFGSILKYIENNFGLGSLGTTDARANSMVDCFDYTQKPRTFSVIPSKYNRAFFLRQRPSYQPVDSE
jgi:phospholipase C